MEVEKLQLINFSLKLSMYTACPCQVVLVFAMLINSEKVTGVIVPEYTPPSGVGSASLASISHTSLTGSPANQG